jgi:peptidyl-prolyl cis-trans isomerase C
MKHKRFIRNTALCLSLAVPFSFLTAAPGCCGEEKGATPKQVSAKPQTDVWAFLPEVVATVGDKKITKKDFMKEVAVVLRATGGKSIPPEYLKQMVPKMVASMVDKVILLGLADQAGVKPSSELVITEFDNMYNSLPAEQKSMMENKLKQQGVTFEEYKKKMGSDVNAQQGMAIEKYIKSNILNKINVSDSDIEKFYNVKKEMFKTPETVVASHILIKPATDTAEAKAAAKAKAEEVLKKVLANPETFGALAASESACPSGKSAQGSLGQVKRGQMVPEFEKVVFTIEPNKISDVVETQFGYHIIKVTEKNAAANVPYEKVKGYIKQQLIGQKVQEALKETLDKEKAKLNVKINV